MNDPKHAYPYPAQGYYPQYPYQGPPVMAPPPCPYQGPPVMAPYPPKKELGFLDGCLAALHCCSFIKDCCYDPSTIFCC